MAFLRQNLDNVAIHDFMAQRHHLAVQFCADALVTNFGVNCVREVNGRRTEREFKHAAFRSECVDFRGRKVDFKGIEEFARLLQFLRPFNQLAHPDDALIVIAAGGFAILVFPMSGDAFFGNAVHFLGANLNFEWLAAMYDGGMQRLIKIWPRHGDVILETARNWAPNVMNDPKRGVATAFAVRDDADGEEIVNLIESAALADDFPAQRKQTLPAVPRFVSHSSF